MTNMTKERFCISKKMLLELLPLIIVLICIIAALILCRPAGVKYDEKRVGLSGGWHDEDGAEYSLDEIPAGDIVLSHELEDIEHDMKRLCFISRDTHFTVLFDGEKEYTYAPEQAVILGKSYGRYIHMIHIPENVCSVTMELHPVYKGRKACIRDIAIEDAGLFMGDVYHKGLSAFSLCVLISLFGVLMLVMGFISLHSGSSDKLDFFALGVFSILVGVWSANDTMILQVFTQRPEIVRLLIYLCLMFISYPPVLFIATATNQRDTKLVPVMRILTAAVFLLNIVLSALGLSDIKLLLPLTHMNIAAAMIMMIYLMLRAAHNKTVDVSFLHTVVTGMTATMIGSVLDLLRFKMVPDSPLGTSLFTKVGVLIFIVLMGIHLMRDRTLAAVELGRAELMEKLAYTDGLTGLANRAAFHEKEEEIREGGINGAVIQIDINCLKKVNDIYGHAEGDRHIINAANIISESFSEIGTSYRIGGDEFIVVVDNDGVGKMEEAIRDMECSIAGYNAENDPPVPLRIAYGCAGFAGDADTLESAEQLADKRMYEKKREMKAQSPT